MIVVYRCNSKRDENIRFQIKSRQYTSRRTFISTVSSLEKLLNNSSVVAINYIWSILISV